MSYPVRCVLVIPKNFPLDKWAFGDTTITWSHAAKAFEDQIKQVQAWVQKETNLAFDYSFNVHFSDLTAVEIGKTPDNDTDPQRTKLDSCSSAVLPEGQGLHSTTLFEKVIKGELGLNTEVPGKHWGRQVIAVINGGGWAGGNASVLNPNNPEDDFGWCIIGDWGIRAQVTGKKDPCNPYTGSPTDAISGSLSHEMMHMFHVHIHKGDTVEDGTILQRTTYPTNYDRPDEPGYNHFTPGQLAEFKKYNTNFLHAPVVVPPIPTPPPPTGETTVPTVDLATLAAINSGFSSAKMRLDQIKALSDKGDYRGALRMLIGFGSIYDVLAEDLRDAKDAVDAD